MVIGLPKKQAQEYTKAQSNILQGFELEEGHSVMLCERGKVNAYRDRKKIQEEKREEMSK